MASKLQNICALSNEVGKSLSDYGKWTAFLKSAAEQKKKHSYERFFYFWLRGWDLPACGRSGGAVEQPTGLFSVPRPSNPTALRSKKRSTLMSASFTFGCGGGI